MDTGRVGQGRECRRDIVTTNPQSIEVPTVDDYCRLRTSAGLTPRSHAAARFGLPQTVVGIALPIRVAMEVQASSSWAQGRCQCLLMIVDIGS
jgi:hypothetical protein